MNVRQDFPANSSEPAEERKALAARPLILKLVGYQMTITVIAPGATVPIHDDEWIGALIVITAGSLRLEGRGGTFQTFPVGSILCFSDLGLRAAHNYDTTPTTIVSTKRIVMHEA